MATELAKAYVQIVPSARGMQSQLSSVFDKEMPTAGSNAGASFGSSMLGKIKGLIAAAGIGKMLSESIMAGADLQQSVGGIETLFKDSADIVIQNAEQAYKTAGLSANDYMEAVTSFSASLLQGLSGDTEKAATIADMALTDMSDNANKMGTDMESIQIAYQGFAKQNYTMLDNLKLGYGGTKSEMERLLADAQKLSGVEYDISNLADVYEAIHVIQEEMDITGTTAKEASSTFSGSLASMKAAFSNVLANLSLGNDIGPSLNALGETVFTFVEGNLLPMVGNILSSLPDLLADVFAMAVRGLNKVTQNADNIAQTGIDLVTGLVDSIVSAVPYLLEAGVNIVMALGKAIINADLSKIGSDLMSTLRNNLDIAAGEILGTDGNIVQSVIDAVMDGLPQFVQTGTDIINGLIQGIVDALPDILETALGIVTSLIEGISGNLPQVLEAGTSVLTTLISGIATVLPDLAESALSIITTLVNGIVENIPEVLEAGKEILLSLVDGIRQSLPDIVDAAGDAIISMVTGLVENLPDIIDAGFDLVVSLIEGIGDAMPDIYEAAGDLVEKIWDAICEIDWLQLGKDIVNGLIQGLGAMGGALIESAQKCGESALGAIKDFFGIASPSKVMRDEVGKFIPAGIAVGISANTKPLTDSMRELTDLTTGTLQADLSTSTLSSAVPLPGQSYKNSAYTINVYGAEGQNVDELADAVMQKIQFAVAREEAGL